MKRIKFHFFDNPGIGGELIKLRLGSTMSHVGMEFENDEFIDSTFSKGLAKEKMNRLRKRPIHTLVVETTDEQYQEALKFIHSKLGTKYDFKAMLGFIFTRKIQDADNYFCSEIGREVFERATGVQVKQAKLTAPHELDLIIRSHLRTKELF